MGKAGLEERLGDLELGGLNINDFRYADDTILIADANESLVELMGAVKQESEQHYLFLKWKKTKGYDYCSDGRVQSGQ